MPTPQGVELEELGGRSNELGGWTLPPPGNSSTENDQTLTDTVKMRSAAATSRQWWSCCWRNPHQGWTRWTKPDVRVYTWLSVNNTLTVSVYCSSTAVTSTYRYIICFIHLLSIYRVAPKNLEHIFLYSLTLPNINRFSKLFHCQNQEKICNNTVTKDPTTPQVCLYTTLWNVSCIKSNN